MKPEEVDLDNLAKQMKARRKLALSKIHAAETERK